MQGDQRLADAESARDLAQQELIEYKRAHAQLLTRVTHDLRTPLNAILGFTQILQSDSSLNEHQRRGVASILESGHKLVGLVDTLLEPKGAAELLAPAAPYREPASSLHVEPELELDAASIPPQEEIAVLHGLALAGSMREILERAQWIEGLNARYAPFTRHVATLARAYESQRVLSFIACHHRSG